MGQSLSKLYVHLIFSLPAGRQARGAVSPYCWERFGARCTLT
jgi:hypothetical protein